MPGPEPRSTRHRPRRLSQRDDEIATCRAPRPQHAREERADDCDGETDDQHAGIELECERRGQIRRYLNLTQNDDARVGEAEAGHRAPAESTRLSVSNCRMTRDRLAPMARRSASSRARSGARLAMR